MMKEDQLLLLDRWEILGTLRRGPTASTLLTYDRRLGRRVVLKSLPLPSNGFTVMRDAARRLTTDMRLAGSLSHPNIVTVYDVLDDDEALYVAMELLEGCNLGQRMREEGPLPVSTALALTRQIGCALAFAHAHGVIHGALTPANVLSLPDGRLRVADFGLATAGAVTADGRALRSPRYVAPEQVQGKTATAATDVWALGVILYEMLTGRPPFEGESLVVCSRVVHDAPRHLRQLRPDIPSAVENVVLTCLEKEPQHRFQTVAALLGALEKAKPVPTRAAVEQETVPQTPRRRPAFRLVAAVLALLVLAWLTWRAVVPDSARHDRTLRATGPSYAVAFSRPTAPGPSG